MPCFFVFFFLSCFLFSSLVPAKTTKKNETKQSRIMEKDSSIPTEQLHVASAKEGARVNRKVLALSLMYGRDCHQSFESLRKSVQVINATKRELVSRMPPRAVAAAAAAAAAAPSASLGDITQPQTCYGCANAFVGQVSDFFSFSLFFWRDRFSSRRVD